jgi:hypothetical protein
MAKPRAVQKSIDDGYTVIPGFDEVVCGSNGGHGKFELVEIGRIGKLFGKGRSGIKQLAVTD